MTEEAGAHYFRFHPHVQFVRGAVGAAVHDLFAARTYWLREPQVATAVSMLAQGEQVETSARSAGLACSALEQYLDALVRLGLGMRTETATVVEGYRPFLLQSQATEHQMLRAGGTATVEISCRCVYDCVWCTSRNLTSPRSCTCGVWPDDKPALPIDALLQGIKQLALQGVDALVVRGGEPFLERPVLWALLDLAQELGLFCEIHTTGLLIGPDDLDRLRGRKIRLALMIAATDDVAFDSGTRSPGSGAGLRALLPRLGASGLPFIAKIPVDVYRLHEAEKCRAWSREAGALDVEYLLYLSEPSLEEMRRAFGPASPSDLAADLSQFHKNGQSHSCFDNEYFITRSGDVAPCIGWRRPLGSLATTSMAELSRHDSFSLVRSTARRVVPTCRGCEFRMGCWACLARTVQINNTAYGPHWNCCYDPRTGEWTESAAISAPAKL